MRSTSSRFDKGTSTFVAATRQCLLMVAVATLTLGWATAAAADGLLVSGQTTCYRLERYPATTPPSPDGLPLAGELVLRDAEGRPEFDRYTGEPTPAFDSLTADVNDYVLLDCAGTGQDGEFQNGARPRYTDRGDGRITDWTTRLTWEKKSDDGGLHDKDNTYTWDEALAYVQTLNNICQNDETLACATDADCAAVGGRCGFAGKRDWRLPNARELQSLVNYGVFSPGPTVDPVFNTNCVSDVTVLTGSCTHADSLTNDENQDLVPVGTPGALPVPYTYWSSTTGDIPGDAWFVDFTTGDAGAHFKDTDIDIDTSVDPPVVAHAGLVRAARGGEGSDDD